MNALLIQGQRGYSKLVAVAGYLQSPLLLALRLYWGWQFFTAGKGHLLNLEKTVKYFESLSIPAPKLNAIMAGTTECVGGLLLLAGLASRLISLPLIVTMIVAYLTADSDAVKGIFKDPDTFTSATPFLFLLTCLIVLAFGPGVFSLDWLIGRKFRAER